MRDPLDVCFVFYHCKIGCVQYESRPLATPLFSGDFSDQKRYRGVVYKFKPIHVN